MVLNNGFKEKGLLNLTKNITLLTPENNGKELRLASNSRDTLAARIHVFVATMYVNTCRFSIDYSL